VKRLVVVLGVAFLLPARFARADVSDTLLTVGYVVPMAFGGIATAVNGTALAYGEPIAHGWRLFGMTVGGIDAAVGATLLITQNDKSEGLVLGSLALGVGAAAFTTGLLAKDDRAVNVGVIKVAGGGVVTFGGRF